MYDSYSLGEISDIQTGPFGSQLHNEDYVENGTPIVTVEHLGNRKFTKQNLPTVSDEDRERLAKYTMKPGDTIFSRVGSVDRSSFVFDNEGGWLFSGRCLRVRPNNSVVDPLYLFYYLNLESTKESIRNIAVGATMPSINTSLLSEIDIELPDIEHQQKISSVLGAIDDIIELNQRINDNLLAVLYSEFEKIKTEYPADSELSHICTLNNQRGSAAELTLDNYYSTENMLANKGGVMPASSMPSDNRAIICEVGDVLISNIRPYFKKIHYCSEKSGCSADVLDFRSYNKQYAPYLYSILYSDEFFEYVVAGSKGTKMPRGDKDQIMQYPIPLPPKDDLDSYCELGQNILSQVTSNNNESTKLISLRDYLLPKLMSGEIDVSTLELPN